MRITYILPLLLITIALSITSCRKDFSTIPSFGALEFSKDTVFLDTVFTNIGSATYNLKVYNRGNDDITIPSIALENGNGSNYRLNVDGIPGKTFENIDILAKDSIFIFIETTIDVTTVTNPIYTDRILFDNGLNEQDVDLVTLVQDANFIFPGRDPITLEVDALTLDGQPTTIQGRFLSDAELNFNNSKPIVIYGYAAVAATKTLTIDAGTKIHFHEDSGLIIDNGATLKVNGTLSEKVVFEGDRLENSFSNIPGQWGIIWMREGSEDNEINHAVIKNGVAGLVVDGIDYGNPTPTLTIKNTEIYNHSNFGVLGRETNITTENVVIGSAGEASFAGLLGGTYNFTHSTFANYWSNGIRTLPTVILNNYIVSTDANGQDVTVTNPNLTTIKINNSIIDGNNNVDFIVDFFDASLFDLQVRNTLIKFNDLNNDFAGVAELDFTNASMYENIILNGNPHFRNAFGNDFIIGQDSDAIGFGNTIGANQVPIDILEVVRTMNPDSGAYQHINF
ncbi:MAG: hypothetical protein JXR05_06935 [Flavobacteriaceae bacterium]